MLFNSLHFAVFFAVVYAVYLALDHKRQNLWLLAASYAFCVSWDWRFFAVLLEMTLVVHFCALKMADSPDPKVRKRFLVLALAACLVNLGVFKYFGFFSDTLVPLLRLLGVSVHPVVLGIGLPVGLSFYAFQAMGYAVDVHRKELDPSRRFSDFALFMAFFPRLIAGPIERGRDLLGQIAAPRRITFSGISDGTYLLFWGLFEKMFVADNLAKLVDGVFSLPFPRVYYGPKILIWGYAVFFQVYCDFDGYSNMARGLAKFLGFELSVNFEAPFIATNVSDYFRRWHITLTRWMRDYVYMPLTFRGNAGVLRAYLNTVLVMMLIAIWHEASLKFFVWGLYLSALFVVYRLTKPLFDRIPQPSSPWLRGGIYSLRALFYSVWGLVIPSILFRANSLPQAASMIAAIAGNFRYVPHAYFEEDLIRVLFFVWVVVAVGVYQHWKKDVLAVPHSAPWWIRAPFYLACFYLIVLFGTSGYEYIYANF
ncbi:MAG TPA: MBOAT family O-acyltransferase [Candidatus Eisenbacteria bacterium]|nr:MBOAT family O-acyltransferase [Candidatus Eisenbacteria bacterium]